MKKILVVLVAISFGVGIFGCRHAPTKEQKRLAEERYYSGVRNYKSLRYRNAVKDFQDAIALNPEYDVAYNDLGCTYFKIAKKIEKISGSKERIKENYEKALKNFKKASEVNLERHNTQKISIDPDYYKNIGIVYDVYLKDYNKAIGYYAKYVWYGGKDKEVQEWIESLKKSKK